MYKECHSRETGNLISFQGSTWEIPNQVGNDQREFSVLSFHRLTDMLLILHSTYDIAFRIFEFDQ